MGQQNVHVLRSGCSGGRRLRTLTGEPLLRHIIDGGLKSMEDELSYLYSPQFSPTRVCIVLSFMFSRVDLCLRKIYSPSGTRALQEVADGAGVRAVQRSSRSCSFRGRSK